MIIKTFGDVSKPKMLTLHPMLADGESMMRIMDHFLGDYCVTLGKIANANSSFALRLMNMIFMMTADKDRKVLENTPHGYIMKVEPYDKNTGIHYRFEQCPIAEFAKAHNYLDLMPAFCNGDYPAMELIHAGLIRKHICVNSDVCDYWIVGDKSPYLTRHIRKKDEKGYWYND